MYRRKIYGLGGWLCVLLICLAALLPVSALGEEARDITRACTVNGRENHEKSPDALRDGSYRRFWESREIVLAAPAGEEIGALLIQWRTIDMPMVIVEKQVNGVWEEVLRDGPKYAAQYVTLPEPQNMIRIRAWDGSVLQICEMTVLTPGDKPKNIQCWRDAPDKVDMMLFATHPDDEVLWFGGLLPLYAGELGKDVLVVNATFNEYVRRLELLDCLWACGVDIYPAMMRWPDVAKSTQYVEETWNARGREPENAMLSLIRRYKPDVVALHDVKGEYGHPAHVVYSKLGRQAVERAAIETEHPESAAQWGVWDVPKTYVHLYKENQIQMDWSQPLAAFGGKTAFQVAEEGLAFHVTQQDNGWNMQRASQYDNSLFGLWRTTVGKDVQGNDMFENIGGQ